MKALFLSMLWPAVACAAACKPQPPKSKAACKLSALSGVDLSVGFDYEGDCVPSTGTLNSFMIFVDFSDAEPVQSETPQSLYEALVPRTIEWYKQASYGALSLNITADLSKFYRMPTSAASYGWERGLTWTEHQVYIQDALDAYTANGTRPPPPNRMSSTLFPLSAPVSEESLDLLPSIHGPIPDRVTMLPGRLSQSQLTHSQLGVRKAGLHWLMKRDTLCAWLTTIRLRTLVWVTMSAAGVPWGMCLALAPISSPGISGAWVGSMTIPSTVL
ncbi:hypothetical protein SNK04_007657 [Fusarium graminearum]